MCLYGFCCDSLAGNVLNVLTRFSLVGKYFFYDNFYLIVPCREIGFNRVPLPGKCFKIFYLLYLLPGCSYEIYSLFPCRENPLWNPFDYFAPLPGLFGIFGNVFLLVWFFVPLKYSLNSGWQDCVLCSLWDRKTLTPWFAMDLCFTVNMSLCFVVVSCPSGNIGGWVWLSERV